MLNHFGRIFFSGRRTGATVNTASPIRRYVAKVERKQFKAEVKGKKYNAEA